MTDVPAPRVGIVVVSHSAELARGLVAVARQMAGSVAVVPAGGRDDDGIGTSYARVSSAIEHAESGGGVVVLSDLGSALMMAETVRDQLPSVARDHVAVVDAPFVEAAVSAAVAAESGADLAGVVAAAEEARHAWPDSARASGEPALDLSSSVTAPSGSGSSGASAPVRFVREVVLRNKDGLHARPAAEFVKLANTFPARVTVNGKDAKSLLGIMSLGLLAGASAEIASSDPNGREAVDALAALVQSRFGETE